MTSADENDDLYPAFAATRATTRRQEMEADYSTGAVTKDSSTDINLNDNSFSIKNEYKTSTTPQDIVKMVKNNPLPRFISNDDKSNISLKQENDIISREQILTKQNTDPDIIKLSRRAHPPEEVISRRMFLPIGWHPYAKMATTFCFP